MQGLSAIRSRIYSFLILSNHINHPVNRIQFGLLSAFNFIAPMVTRMVPVTLVLHIDDFILKVRIGQTEISPLFEIWNAFALGVFGDKQQFPDWTVIDCGANIGQFSVFFKNAQRIVAVEPNSAIIPRLTWNLEANNIRSTIVDKAVSSKIGTVRMQFSSKDTTNSHVVDDGGIDVNTTTIDQIIDDLDIEWVDLLKLDLEEHEVSALEGAKQSLLSGKIRRIYTEFRSDALLKQQDDMLVPLGYKRAAIVPCCSAIYVLRSSL